MPYTFFSAKSINDILESQMGGTTYNQRGFTIVELLIVIVVIGILAAITVVAYNNIQGRANDARRIEDIKTITKALEVYKANNGVYPTPNSTTGASGWEVTTDGTNPTDFISALRTSGVASQVPKDPRNTGTPGNMGPSNSGSNYIFFYYRYTAGSYGCPAANGDFYVLGITRMDTVVSGGTYSSSPGFNCTGRDWSTAGAFVTGAYTNQ